MNNFNSYLAQGIGALPSSLVSATLIVISILMLTVALERGYVLFRANIPLIAEEGGFIGVDAQQLGCFCHDGLSLFRDRLDRRLGGHVEPALQRPSTATVDIGAPGVGIPVLAASTSSCH